MTCNRHSYIWIPRVDATFENKKTGELIAGSITSRNLGHFAPVWVTCTQRVPNTICPLWGKEITNERNH